MPSPFHALMAVVDQTIDTLQVEPFLWTPMREVKNGNPVPDPTRQPSTLTLTFENRALEMDRNRGEAMVPRTSAQPMASIRGVNSVQTGDRLRRDATLKLYQVTTIHPDGIGRTYLVLIEI